MKSKIYLIGMPGSGKSFFGNRLIEYMDYRLVDLDKEIEAKEGREIAEIFGSEGEEYFRKIEAEMLRSISESDDSLVISTGGGTPCFHNGIDYMNKNGVTVFLETERELLIERLTRKSHRPLISDDVAKNVDDLLESRMNYYSQADISIDHRDPELVIKNIGLLNK